MEKIYKESGGKPLSSADEMDAVAGDKDAS
jgi:hypothetical protein